MFRARLVDLFSEARECVAVIVVAGILALGVFKALELFVGWP